MNELEEQLRPSTPEVCYLDAGRPHSRAEVARVTRVTVDEIQRELDVHPNWRRS